MICSRLWRDIFTVVTRCCHRCGMMVSHKWDDLAAKDILSFSKNNFFLVLARIEYLNE